MTSNHSSRHIFRETVVYGVGTVLSQVLSALRGMMVAALLGPVEYGFWKVIQVGLDYLGYTHFGFMHGMARQIPLYRAAGESEKDHGTRQITLGMTLLTSLGAGGLVILAAMPMAAEVRLAWVGVACVLLPTQLFRFLHMICLADGRFAVLSGANVLLAVASFIVMAWWIPRWGLAGVFLGLGAGYWAGVLFGWVRGIYPWPPGFNWVHITRRQVDPLVLPLLQNGFPFMCVDGLFVVWQGVDRLALASVLGASNEAMGHYGLSVMIASFAIQIPQIVNRVLFRRTISGFADENPERNDRLNFARKHLDLPALAVAGWSPIVFCPCLIGSACMIRWFLPEYQAAVPLVAWQMAACYWCGVGLLVRNVFTATNRQWRLGMIYLAAISGTVATIYALWLLVPEHAGLGAAIGGIGSLVGAVLAAFCSLFDLGRHFRYGAWHLGSLCGGCLLPFLPFSIWMIHFIDFYQSWSPGHPIPMWSLFLESVWSLAACLPAALWALWKMKGLNLRQSVSTTESDHR